MNTVEVGQQILSEHTFIYYVQNFYAYNKGCYRLLDECRILGWIKDILLDEYSSHKVREVVNYLKAECYIEEWEVSNKLYLNLKNGLFDAMNFELIPHTSDLYSTIQLNVNYNSEAKCEKWIATLDQIFEGDNEKIRLLQEYFGLCLVTDTKYEKALILIGEGANGKSVVLHVLQKILGDANYSAIPLEQFNNPHYIANLFGKLANISIETNAKSSVYDSTFKAVVSGDSIEADAKFKRPFKFHPYCKLIFALNNMPRVDDKTSAFFRRLLILRFNKSFKEEEQNKNLKHDLFSEFDGIFYWLLEGLKRLVDRGHFQTTTEMKKELDEYKKENNNVIIFTEECCKFSPDQSVGKDVLYSKFSSWCKENNHHPLSKIKFGKELMKLYPDIDGEQRISGKRSWIGIDKDFFG